MGTGSRGDRQEKANSGLWLQRGHVGQRGCPPSIVPPGTAPSFPGPEGSHPAPARGSSCSRSGRRSCLQTTPLPQPQSGLPPWGSGGAAEPSWSHISGAPTACIPTHPPRGSWTHTLRPHQLTVPQTHPQTPIPETHTHRGSHADTHCRNSCRRRTV